MIIFKLNLFMHKKRIKTNIFGVSLKRQALYPPLRHILDGTPKIIRYYLNVLWFKNLTCKKLKRLR